MRTDEKVFPIQVVARRTGLNVEVLRAWERRYRVVEPERSEGGRRLYSGGDIEHLSLLARAVDRGLRIGDARRMNDATLRAFLAERASSDEAERRASAVRRGAAGTGALQSPAPGAFDGEPADTAAWLLAACKKAVRQFDSAGLTRALARANVALSLRELVDGVVAPLLVWIGERWSEGTICVAQEHAASTIVRTMLLADVAGSAAGAEAPCVVVTTPAHELHEIGALFAAVAASAAGWRVEYLGPNLPAGEVALAARRCVASAVALSVARPVRDSAVAAELKELRKLLPRKIPIFLGGDGAGRYAAAIQSAGIWRCSDCWSFARHLEARGGGSR
jgi:DNA-binding transcriptional MerR regulator/methylmalonyl-CoA mutase cobalamin-binding subunit